MEDSPGFEVGDGLLDGPSELVDFFVVPFRVLAHVLVLWLAVGGGHAATDVALVADVLGGVLSVEDAVGIEGWTVPALVEGGAYSAGS